MKDLFSIGEVAKYQKISKQTLIFYDKIGLFCPVYVDPDNGYRYYSASQLDELDTILIMKKIGFSLNDIREHLQNYNIDSSLAAFRQQMEVIDQKIGELRLIRSRVAQRCTQMEQAKKYLDETGGDDGGSMPGPGVTVEEMEEQYILVREIEEPYTLRETSVATKQCFAEAFEKQLPVFFESGVTVPLSKIREGRFTEASHAFLLTEKTEQAEEIRCLPAGRIAGTFHRGDYASIGSSYRRILDYCDANSLEIISDSYEFCINDYITSHDEDEYITRILFYIR
ncbi:MAG TPA: MerR family transcriptional regulator [Candidatus Mediterraneibacter cottocaccae]|nr:MerR family transcriptional regulator [Candidatus Mediterraneibacter cottocaccae]